MASAPSNQSATVKTFGDALRLQARVIYALILRETRTTFGDSKLGYLWALLEPIAYLGVFIIIFTSIGRSSPLPGDIPYFFVTGLLPYLMLKKIVDRVMSAEDANESLMTYPQVTTFDVKLARAILETSIHFIILVFLLAVLPLLGYTHTPINSMTMMILCLLMLAAFGFSLGCFNSFIIKFWPNYEKVYNLTVMRALFFLSGVFYLPEAIPQPYGDWLLLNPLCRFIAWFRESTYSNFESTFSVNMNFFLVILCCIFLGLVLEKKGVN